MSFAPVTRHDRIPTVWGEGAFAGNGLIGFMAYAPDGHRMAWEIGRTDVSERREGAEFDCDEFRVPIGRVILEGVTGEGELEMDLDVAEVRGRAGDVGFRSIAHAIHDVILIELDGPGRLGFQPGYSMPLSVGVGRAISAAWMNPPPVLSVREGRLACAQSASPGTPYATVIEDRGGGRFAVAIGWSADPLADAERLLDETRDLDWDGLFASHRAWWADYRAASSVSVPDAGLQRTLDLQLYKLACATRADRPAMDLLGPWTHQTVWAAVWWNLNIQLCYLPVYAANHPELGESFLRLLKDGAPAFAANAEPWPDASAVGRATGRDGVGPLHENERCNLPWACHVAWTHYRYTMDRSVLDDLLPLLRRAMTFYRHLLTEGDDGFLHLPIGHSPEYATDGPDAHIDLALLRWGASVLGEGDPEWAEIAARLTPYPTDENGFMVAAGVPFTESHRHFSHLLAVHPLRSIDLSVPENRELVERSVAHWTGLDKEFYGYSFMAAASIYAQLGDGDRALAWLERYPERFGTPNGMYLEYPEVGMPTLETPLTVLSAVQDMLLQSHGGTIRIFPAVPSRWADVEFVTWRTEGAFLASARREGGRTVAVEIRSLVGGPCRVVPGIGRAQVTIDGIAVDVGAAEGVYECATVPGTTIRFVRA